MGLPTGRSLDFSLRPLGGSATPITLIFTDLTDKGILMGINRSYATREHLCEAYEQWCELCKKHNEDPYGQWSDLRKSHVAGDRARFSRRTVKRPL